MLDIKYIYIREYNHPAIMLKDLHEWVQYILPINSRTKEIFDKANVKYVKDPEVIKHKVKREYMEEI